MSVLSLVTITNAHDFTLFKTDQKLDNKHEISISLLNSENFSIITILCIFGILFFFFLIYVIWILYKGIPSIAQSATQQQTNETESTEIPMEEIVTPNIQQRCARPGFILPNTHEQLNITRLQIPYIQQTQTMSRIPTPVPAKRSKISPIVKLERELYESRRESVTTIYPILDLEKIEDMEIIM